MPENCVAQAILFFVRNNNGKNLFKHSNEIIYESFLINRQVQLVFKLKTRSGIGISSHFRHDLVFVCEQRTEKDCKTSQGICE